LDISTDKEYSFVSFCFSVICRHVPFCARIIVRYCYLVRPFLNEEDYQKTKQIVLEFGRGIGKDLHNQLLEFAKDKRNWV